MRGPRVGFKLAAFEGAVTPGRETWEAFWEGGPRKSDGGGSRRSCVLVFGDCDIF